MAASIKLFFFGAADDTRATDDRPAGRLAGRPAECPVERPAERPTQKSLQAALIKPETKYKRSYACLGALDKF